MAELSEATDQSLQGGDDKDVDSSDDSVDTVDSDRDDNCDVFSGNGYDDDVVVVNDVISPWLWR